MSMTDVWDGFANLLAELIEKHAAELSFDDIPTSNNDSNDRSNEHTDTELTVDKPDSA
jgi:hypothetical protein